MTQPEVSAVPHRVFRVFCLRILAMLSGRYPVFMRAGTVGENPFFDIMTFITKRIIHL